MSSAPWRREYCHTYIDERFAALSNYSKLALLFIRGGPHSTCIPGYYVVNAGMIEGLLGMPDCLGPDDGYGCYQSTELWNGNQILEELSSAGLIETDGRVVILPKFMRYHAPESKNNLLQWRNKFREMPHGDLYYRWLEICRDWYETEAPDSRKCEFEAVFGIIDTPTPRDTPTPTSTPGGSRERERERETERKKESCRAEAVATSGVGKSLVTEAHDLTTARAEKRLAQVEVLEEWSNGLIEFVPDAYQAYLPYLLAEVVDLVIENRSRRNETFTVKRRADFARRMAKCQPLDQMLAMEIFVDRAPTADERYPAKIAETMRHYTDAEIGSERDKHRSKHPSGAWAQWKRDTRKRAKGAQ